jgi:hypothetical protein
MLVIAAGAHLRDAALDYDRPDIAMLLDKGVPHRDSLAKYAVAFSKMSRFMRTRDSSAFSRAISIYSAVRSLPRTSRRRPAASTFTQLSSDCAATPSVRAADASVSRPRINPTASFDRFLLAKGGVRQGQDHFRCLTIMCTGGKCMK